MRFSIRDLMLATVIVALAVGWSVHAARSAAISRENKSLRSKLDTVLSVARDMAQLTIEVKDDGQVSVLTPAGWPQTLADQMVPIPPPSTAPPLGVDYPVARQR
jgi:hypothetical protein